MAINYVGTKFANGWEVKEKYSCNEYKKIYEEATGDTSKQIKNAHYLCYNSNCGVFTYIESSTIKRNLSKDMLSKCKGCDGVNCYYRNAIRVKNVTQVKNGELMKTPDRKEKLKTGETIGLFNLIDYISSENFSDHQRRAKIKCNLCGKEQICRADKFLEGSVACECFKKHSSGEAYVKQILEKNSIPYCTEYTFSDLVGEGGGLLRYDFALLDEKSQPYAFIEFDGQQHFQEAGSFYNESGRVQIHDNKKNEYLKEKNLPLLRIAYFDFLQTEELIYSFLKTIYK